MSRLSLPLEIHAATRNQHTALNRLITSRLGLCLPPHVATLQLYTLGIAAFAPIYFGFEAASDGSTPEDGDGAQSASAPSHLPTPGLARTQRLKDDLRILRKRAGELPSSDREPYEEKIREMLRADPHRKLAYQWVMYMALFNGGRWIRSQLVAAGSEFWRSDVADKDDQDIDCLTFWQFPGEEDGEDIKHAFRSSFEAAAARLTDDQRREVIEETKRVFEFCSEIVLWLDTASTLSPDVSSREVATRSFWPNFPSSGFVDLIKRFWQRLSMAVVYWRVPGYSVLVRQDSHPE